MDVMQSCRCCMLYPPDKNLTTPYTHLGKTEIYSEMLKECFDLHLILDGDECGICEECVGRLRGASDFKLQVQRSQAALRARLTEAVHIKVEPTIKSEMPDDDSTGDESMLETLVEPTIKSEMPDDDSTGDESMLETLDEDEVVIKTEITDGTETDVDPLLKLESLDEDRISEEMVTTDETENHTEDSTVVTQDGLREKSKRSYNKTYSNFMDWKLNKKDTSFSEDILLEYFQHLCNCNQKPSTLWTVYSMLKSTIQLYHQEDISGYTNLLAFLKKEYNGYKGKQARTFSSDELNTFIDDSSDEEFLLTKVVAIFGIAGACRRHELHHLLYNDVIDSEEKDTLIVRIRNNKNNVHRTFTITGKYYNVCKKYLTLRKNSTCNKPKFFLRYFKGKCTTYNVGIKAFGRMGKIVAGELKLPNPELYTGHCFKRTSAMISQSINGSNTLFISRPK